jgi:hypothetical protein
VTNDPRKPAPPVTITFLSCQNVEGFKFEGSRLDIILYSIFLYAAGIGLSF